MKCDACMQPEFCTRADCVSVKPVEPLLTFALIKTERRLTFDIEQQAYGVTYFGDDDGDYFTFVASNGYHVISRSRMDIQTERLWLLGASIERRSGTMVFSTNEKRDRAYEEFLKALREWARHHNGTICQTNA